MYKIYGRTPTKNRYMTEEERLKFDKMLEEMRHLFQNARESVPSTFSDLFSDMQKRDKDTNKRIDDFHEVFKKHLEEDIKFKEEDLKWKNNLTELISTFKQDMSNYKFGWKIIVPAVTIISGLLLYIWTLFTKKVGL